LSLFGCKASDEAAKPDDAGVHSPQAGHSSTGVTGGQGAAAHGGSSNPNVQGGMGAVGGMGFPQAGGQGPQPGAGTGGMSSGPHARVTFQLKGVQ
jgi:hypothetical protein